MRAIAMLGLLAAAAAVADPGDYEEIRELALDADGIAALRIEAGAGRLEVNGVDGADRIAVVATVRVPGRDAEDARSAIADGLELELSVVGTEARLVSNFERSFWQFGDSPRIDLELRVPARLSVSIEDGSGSIDVSALAGDLVIEDGSGSIEVRDIGGSVDIDDGSGSINVSTVGGDLAIVDGSGSITARAIGGSVIVDDGSGSVTVSDVERDLVILDDGSGSLKFSNVRGQVDDRSSIRP